MKRKSFLAKAFMMLFAVLFSFTGARADELTVYDGETLSYYAPAYMFYFDDFTRTQVVIPSDDLEVMAGGGTISALTFYTDQTEEYTTPSEVDVYLMEVDYTNISAFEPKSGIVYQGTLTVAATTGELTIELATPYVYNGGNLLIGVDNTTDAGYKGVKFYGQEVEGACVGGYNSGSLDAVTPSQRNFIPKTTFTYTPGTGVVYAKPLDLTVTNLTAHEATLSWVEPEGKVDGYAYQLKKATEEWSTEETTITGTSVDFTTLEPGTSYSFRVKAIYGEEASSYASVNFNTDCELTTLPYDDSFDGNINCWTVVNLSSNTPGLYDLSGNTAFRFSSYSSSSVYDQYLISPEFDGSSAMDVEFKYIPYNGEETFQVGYSTTTTDLEAFTWGDEIVTSANDWMLWSGTFPEGTKYVAIHYYSSYKYYLFVDDFSFTVNNGFYRPTDLAVSEVGATSAKFSWTENGTATAWEICVNDDNPIAASTNPFVLEGLTPETDYTVKVRATDGTNFSKWSEEVSFTTPELYPVVTELAAEPSATTAVISWNGSADSYNLRYKSGFGDIAWTQVGSNETATAEAVTYTFDLSGYEGTGSIAIRHYNITDMFKLIVDDITITNVGGDIVLFENFESGSIPGNWENLDKDGDGYKWDILTSTDDGGNPINSFVASSSYVNYVGAVTPDNWLIIPDVELGGTLTFVAYGLDPDWCSEVFGVFVGQGDAAEWTTVNNVTSPYTIEGLIPLTDYEVEVQAVYAEGESKWATTSFTTLDSNPIATDVVVTPGSRTATIEWTGISDSYEVMYRTPAILGAPSFFEDFEGLTDGALPEGWTAIDNDGDGNNWITHTNNGEGGNYSTYSGDGVATSASYIDAPLTPDNWLITPKITLGGNVGVWMRGQDASWSGEHVALYVSTEATIADVSSFTLLMPETVVTGEYVQYTADLSAYEGQEGYIAIRHFNITDMFWLNVDDFGVYQAVPAGEWTTVTTTDTSVELTGLAPETEYEFTIIGIKDGTANAGTAIATFTTGTAFPTPTSLAADNITTTSAEISWTADATATGAVLEYTKTEGAPIVTTMYQYDNGSPESALGAGGAAFSYAVMFPAGSYSGNSLTSVSVYDYLAADETITIYNDGTTEPANAIASKPITFTGSNTFVEVSFDELEFDSTKNLWVVVSNNSGNNIAYAEDTLNDPNARWTYLGGWGDLAEMGVPGAIWLVHVGIGALDLSAATWTTVEDATSPYELKDLTPETNYAVRVKSIFGTEGESEWTYTNFTTLPDNPVPFNIVADLAANGATLGWEGEGDSYNVQYRTAEFADPVYETSFYNLDDWTVYTEGEGDGWMITDYGATAYSYDNPTYTALHADNWLVSPAIELGGVLMFTPMTASAYPDSYEVLLSTTGNAIEDFTTTLKAMAIADNETVSINLSNYAGQTGYIAIHHVSYDCFILAISDFGIYNMVPAGEWQTIATTEPTATISGLATNNTYEYQVQSIKGSNTSEWSAVDEFALVTLNCEGDNEDLVNKFNGKFAHVTLANRSFYKDGTWNTIYLPFDLNADQIAASPLADGDIRTLASLTVEGQSVTMNFADALGMYSSYGYPDFIGGFPYIIKWAAGGTVANPEFANVTISNAAYYQPIKSEDESIEIDFEGTYKKYSFDSDNTSVLFIGADNKLNYPLAGASIGATCCYFTLNGVSAAEGNGVKFFTNLDDEDATGIAGINAKESGEWYDISGRKLASKPSIKGIYVNGGRKVTVK